MQRSISATTEIFRILDSEPSVKEQPGAIELQSCAGRIEFEHVKFRYATGSADAVVDLNLRIEPGKSYALVGASGAGKSTVLSLILRLYNRKSTRLNSSHSQISYAVFCLKKKKSIK